MTNEGRTGEFTLKDDQMKAMYQKGKSGNSSDSSMPSIK